MSSCECYKIGGPFIAEDPDCPVHQAGGYEAQLEDLRRQLQEADADKERIIEALDWTERNFRLAVQNKPVRDMTECLENNKVIRAKYQKDTLSSTTTIS